MKKENEKIEAHDILHCIYKLKDNKTLKAYVSCTCHEACHSSCACGFHSMNYISIDKSPMSLISIYTVTSFLKYLKHLKKCKSISEISRFNQDDLEKLLRLPTYYIKDIFEFFSSEKTGMFQNKKISRLK